MSHPNPAFDPENSYPDDAMPSGGRARALYKKKLKVQSINHGTRHLHARGGKMVEAPLIKMKRLNSRENIRVK